MEKEIKIVRFIDRMIQWAWEMKDNFRGQVVSYTMNDSVYYRIQHKTLGNIHIEFFPDYDPADSGILRL